MARDYNKVILMGRLARDPDVRFTPSKQKVARITVATGRQWKNKATGELQSHTDFVSVVAWGFAADICEKYLKKGRQLLVEGRISVRDYDDVKTGTRKWVTEVVAENIILLGSSQRDDSSASDYRPQASQSQRDDGYARQDTSSDAVFGGNMGSLRDEAGFEDEFPLDFSELGSSDSSGDVQIPF